MTNRTTRRIFIGAATAASAMRVWGANDRINLAIVGLGGRGTGHLNIYSRLPDVRVSGLCDVNQAAREKAQATLTKNAGETAKQYEDMREAFADPDIEAVSIATPNHWHALCGIWAMQASVRSSKGSRPLSARERTQSRPSKKAVKANSRSRTPPSSLSMNNTMHRSSATWRTTTLTSHWRPALT